MTTDHQTEKQLLLYRLTRIIKALYPHKQTQNPYKPEHLELTKYLDLETQLLFVDVLHSLTLLNNHSRMNTEGQLISTQIDYLNALQLVLPKELQLTAKTLEIHTELSNIFKQNPFTYVSACSILKLSHSTMKRLTRPLLIHGLLRKHLEKGGKKTLLQVVETNQEPDTSHDLFAEGQGDWAGFQGFVEL
ncbi:MAG: hypothetical protein JXR03_21525 [Cyclobacteriaceae bacterium]